MIFEFAKRIIPFGIAAVIGVLAAMPFAVASSPTQNAQSVDTEVRLELKRLRHENCRLKRQMRDLEREMIFDRELFVPAPPAPPVTPLAPEAPAPPRAPKAPGTE